MDLLVIDPNPGIHHALERLFESYPEVTLVSCTTVQAAEQRLSLDAPLPLALLMDVWVAGDRGLDFLNKVKQHYPSLMKTCWMMEGVLDEASDFTDHLRLGVVGILKKPNDLPSLLQLLREPLDGLRQGKHASGEKEPVWMNQEDFALISSIPITPSSILSPDDPLSPAQKLEATFKDQGLWTPAAAALVESLEERLTPEEQRDLWRLWIKKLPPSV